MNKEDLELAEAKIVAENDSNEWWSIVQRTMYDYLHGRESRNKLESDFAHFKASHNIDIGLRHER